MNIVDFYKTLSICSSDYTGDIVSFLEEKYKLFLNNHNNVELPYSQKEVNCFKNIHSAIERSFLVRELLGLLQHTSRENHQKLIINSLRQYRMYGKESVFSKVILPILVFMRCIECVKMMIIAFN